MQNCMEEKQATFIYDIIVSDNPGVDGYYILLDSRCDDLYSNEKAMREAIENIHVGPFDLVYKNKIKDYHLSE